jgi:type I restriction enzyme, S subunit
MSDLPDGWEWARLGDLLATIEAGRSFRCFSRPAGPEEWGVVKVSAMTWDQFDEDENKAVLADEHADPRFEIRPGDLLFSRANTVRYVGAVVEVRKTRPHLLLSDKSLRLVSRPGVSPRWLLYYLRTPRARRYLESVATGTSDSMRNISQANLRSTAIPIAPLDEQNRIVASIEEQFSRLDAGFASLRNARQNLRIMRDAVFADAMAQSTGSGASKVSFGSILQEPLRNGYSAKADPFGTVPIISLTAVTSGDFGARNVKMTAADPARVRDLWIRPGDLLIERSNTPELVGTACLYRGEPDTVVYPDLIIRARVDDRVMPEYAELALKAPASRHYFQRRAQGISGSMPKISQQIIEDLEFPLPLPEAQASIVQGASRKLSLIASLQESLGFTERRSATLRSSILSAAFSGKLT